MSSGFIDRVRIYVRGGDGGDGCVSFERQAFRPRGGPDGGDGGRGGHVVLRADENVQTLRDFKHRAHFKAGRGAHGRGGRKNGRHGQDLEVVVPVGTLVFAEDKGRYLADLTRHGERVVVARGGRGGRGNQHFADAQRQAPRDYELGEPGEERWLTLDLRLVAEVGIVGFPNAGKSTLLSRISRAHPRIADYPFTTLSPVLGVVSPPSSSHPATRRAVFADIPGLIEGASQGAGLGHEFLRHVERTRVLLHLLDLAAIEASDPLYSYRAVRRELEKHRADLAERPEVLALNKIDLAGKEPAREALRRACRSRGLALHEVSCLTGEGLEGLVEAVFAELRRCPPLPPSLVEVEPLPRERGFEVEREEQAWRVRGHRVERVVAMTDLEAEEPLRRLQRQLVAWGVEDALREAGARPGDTVRIGASEFEFHPEGEDSRGTRVRPSQRRRLVERKRLLSLRSEARRFKSRRR